MDYIRNIVDKNKQMLKKWRYIKEDIAGLFPIGMFLKQYQDSILSAFANNMSYNINKLKNEYKEMIENDGSVLGSISFNEFENSATIDMNFRVFECYTGKVSVDISVDNETSFIIMNAYTDVDNEYNDDAISAIINRYNDVYLNYEEREKIIDILCMFISDIVNYVFEYRCKDILMVFVDVNDDLMKASDLMYILKNELSRSIFNISGVVDKYLRVIINVDYYQILIELLSYDKSVYMYANYVYMIGSKKFEQMYYKTSKGKLKLEKMKDINMENVLEFINLLKDDIDSLLGVNLDQVKRSVYKLEGLDIIGSKRLNLKGDLLFKKNSNEYDVLKTSDKLDDDIEYLPLDDAFILRKNPEKSVKGGIFYVDNDNQDLIEDDTTTVDDVGATIHGILGVKFNDGLLKVKKFDILDDVDWLKEGFKKARSKVKNLGKKNEGIGEFSSVKSYNDVSDNVVDYSDVKQDDKEVDNKKKDVDSGDKVKTHIFLYNDRLELTDEEKKYIYSIVNNGVLDEMMKNGDIGESFYNIVKDMGFKYTSKEYNDEIIKKVELYEDGDIKLRFVEIEYVKKDDVRESLKRYDGRLYFVYKESLDNLYLSDIKKTFNSVKELDGYEPDTVLNSGYKIDDIEKKFVGYNMKMVNIDGIDYLFVFNNNMLYIFKYLSKTVIESRVNKVNNVKKVYEKKRDSLDSRYVKVYDAIFERKEIKSSMNVYNESDMISKMVDNIVNVLDQIKGGFSFKYKTVLRFNKYIDNSDGSFNNDDYTEDQLSYVLLYLIYKLMIKVGDKIKPLYDSGIFRVGFTGLVKKVYNNKLTFEKMEELLYSIDIGIETLCRRNNLKDNAAFSLDIGVKFDKASNVSGDDALFLDGLIKLLNEYVKVDIADRLYGEFGLQSYYKSRSDFINKLKDDFNRKLRFLFSALNSNINYDVVSMKKQINFSLYILLFGESNNKYFVKNLYDLFSSKKSESYKLSKKRKYNEDITSTNILDIASVSDYMVDKVSNKNSVVYASVFDDYINKSSGKNSGKIVKTIKYNKVAGIMNRYNYLFTIYHEGIIKRLNKYIVLNDHINIKGYIEYLMKDDGLVSIEEKRDVKIFLNDNESNLLVYKSGDYLIVFDNKFERCIVFSINNEVVNEKLSKEHINIIKENMIKKFKRSGLRYGQMKSLKERLRKGYSKVIRKLKKYR